MNFMKEIHMKETTMTNWQRWIGGLVIGYCISDFLTKGPDLIQLFGIVIMFSAFLLDIVKSPPKQ